MVYFEKERNARLLGRIEETLKAKDLRYTLLDVTGDETTKDFVMREAHVKEDELPIVFVAGTPIGGYNELTDWDVSGKLDKIIFPR
jgi:glutaredoxin